MTVQKALLFKDVKKAKQIMTLRCPQVKALGRKVDNFDEKKWATARESIVVEGNMHKFGQNAELKAKLLATGDKKIVEASPVDRIWGIGFGEQDALENKDHWGLNLLGVALEKTRRILRGVGPI